MRRCIKVITHDQLQVGIDAAIARFQKSVNFNLHPRKGVLEVWTFLQEHGPCTYRDIRHLFPHARWPGAHAASRLDHLMKNGWAEVVGRAKPMYRGEVIGPLPYGAKLFAATFRQPNNKLVAEARKQLYLTVDKLLQQAEQIPMCLAGRFDELSGLGRDNLFERNLAIVDARLEGHTLEVIGKQHGITRERTRQIISRALKL